MPKSKNPASPTLLRKAEVIERLGVSEKSIERYMRLNPKHPDRQLRVAEWRKPATGGGDAPMFDEVEVTRFENVLKTRAIETADAEPSRSLASVGAARSGELRAAKIGRGLRVHREDLDTFTRSLFESPAAPRARVARAGARGRVLDVDPERAAEILRDVPPPRRPGRQRL